MDIHNSFMKKDFDIFHGLPFQRTIWLFNISGADYGKIPIIHTD